jgi:hypothetical protein
MAEAVLFHDILPDLSANNNSYKEPFVTAYYNQFGLDMLQRALLSHGSKWLVMLENLASNTGLCAAVCTVDIFHNRFAILQ